MLNREAIYPRPAVPFRFARSAPDFWRSTAASDEGARFVPLDGAVFARAQAVAVLARAVRVAHGFLCGTRRGRDSAFACVASARLFALSRPDFSSALPAACNGAGLDGVSVVSAPVRVKPSAPGFAAD